MRRSRRSATIDILVNDPGTTIATSRSWRSKEAEFDRIFAVNVKSIFLHRAGLRSAYARAWRRRVHQRWVDRGASPRPGLTVYNASKGAVHG